MSVETFMANKGKLNDLAWTKEKRLVQLYAAMYNPGLAAAVPSATYVKVSYDLISQNGLIIKASKIRDTDQLHSAASRYKELDEASQDFSYKEVLLKLLPDNNTIIKSSLESPVEFWAKRSQTGNLHLYPSIAPKHKVIQNSKACEEYSKRHNQWLRVCAVKQHYWNILAIAAKYHVEPPLRRDQLILVEISSLTILLRAKSIMFFDTSYLYWHPESIQSKMSCHVI